MSENREAYQEAAIREGADEVSLRADEVGTLKAFINIDHIPSNLQRNRREGMGRAVLSVQRDEQGNRSQKTK